MKPRWEGLDLAVSLLMISLFTGCVFDTSGVVPPPERSSPTFVGEARIERDINSHFVQAPPPFVMKWSCLSCGTEDLDGDLDKDSADVDLALETLLTRFINDEIRSNHSSVRILNRSSFLNGSIAPAPTSFSVQPNNINNPPALGGQLGSTVLIPGSTGAESLINIDVNIRVGRDYRDIVGQTNVMEGISQFYLKRLYTSIGADQPEERLVVTGMVLRGNDFDAVVSGHKLRVSNVSLIAYQPFEMIVGPKQTGIASGLSSWDFYNVQASPLFLSMDVEKLGPVRSRVSVSVPFQFNLDYIVSPNATAPPPFQAKMSFAPKDAGFKAEGSITVELAGSWENRAPVPDAGPNSVETCIGDGVAHVALNGNATQDFDDPSALLQFMWIKDYNVQGKEELLSIQKTETVSLPVGTHQISLFVWDQLYGMGRDDKVVTVEAKPPEISLSVKPSNVKVSALQFGKMLNFDTLLHLTKYCHNLAGASIKVCGDSDPRSQYNNDPSQDYDFEINGVQFHKKKCGSLDLTPTPTVPVALKLRQRNDGPNNTFKYQIEVRVQDTGGAVASKEAFVVMSK